MAAVSTPLFAAFVSLGLIVPTAIFFWLRIDEPYMDEIFHIPQAQRYCSGDFESWDPKITTLPGLYLFAAALQPLLSFLPLPPSASAEIPPACAPKVLRASNAVLGVLLAAVSGRILDKLHPAPALATPRRLRACAVVLFPVLFFYYFLFYTDALSTLLVLVMYERALSSDSLAASLFGAAAFMCRQTNAVWILFVAGTLALERVAAAQQSSRTGQTKRRQEEAKEEEEEGSEKKTKREEEEGSVLWEATVALRLVLSSLFLPVLRRTAGLVLVLVGVLTFVWRNKGIAVGDKTNHQPGLYPMQAGYLAAFIAGSLAPWLCVPALLPLFLRFCRSHVLFSLVTLASILTAVHFFTYAHPFLLADNRHYTFYLWKNVFRRHFLPRYLLSFFYLYSGWAVAHTLSSTSSRLWLLWFGLCSALLVIPTGLLEFRYFLVPALLALLHAPFSPQRWLLQEGLGLVAFVLLNAATILLFLLKPFSWPDGSVARFMW